MDLLDDIAKDLGIPRESIEIRKTHDTIIWFVVGGQQHWVARTVHGGKRLKKNSIRKDMS
jgi:hypothetical protein